MASHKTKSKQLVSFSINKQVLNKFKIQCDRNAINKSLLIEHYMKEISNNYKSNPKYQPNNEHYCLIYCIGYILNIDPELLITDKIKNYLKNDYRNQKIIDYYNVILDQPLLKPYDIIEFEYNAYKNAKIPLTLFPINSHCIVNIISCRDNKDDKNNKHHAVVGYLDDTTNITMIYDPDNSLEYCKTKPIEYVSFITIR